MIVGTGFWIFAALSAAGLIYFVIIRKVFDFLSVAFVGQLIYFLPGFYGYVGNPNSPGVLPSIPIAPQLYAIWSICLAGTLIAGLLYRPEPRAVPPLQTSRSMDLSLLGVIGLSAAIVFYTEGDAIFSTDKQDVLENIDRIFLLFASTCQLAMIAFTIQRKWLLAIVPGIGLLFLLYIGFRAEFALSVIAIFTYIARQRGIFVFLRPKYLVASLGAAAVLLAYKPFLTAYRLGNWRTLELLQMSNTFTDTMILQFEPFLTQAVLNQVVMRNFAVPASSLIDAMVALVPFLAPAIGMLPEEVSFNFQNILFPHVDYGLTASPQSQFIAGLGWFGLVLFVIVHNVAMVAASHGLKTRSAAGKLLILGIGAFLAFYIQRNDLANSLTLINRVVIGVALIWIGSYVMTAGQLTHPAAPEPEGPGRDGEGE